MKPAASVAFHDLGGVAAKKIVAGKEVRGFKVYVGGGLGAVPHQAKLLEEFVPAEEFIAAGAGHGPGVCPAG